MNTIKKIIGTVLMSIGFLIFIFINSTLCLIALILGYIRLGFIYLFRRDLYSTYKNKLCDRTYP